MHRFFIPTNRKAKEDSVWLYTSTMNELHTPRLTIMVDLSKYLQYTGEMLPYSQLQKLSMIQLIF